MKTVENTGFNDWMYIGIEGFVETIGNTGFKISMNIEKTVLKNNDVHRMNRASNSNGFFLLPIPMFKHEQTSNSRINHIFQKEVR